MFPDFSIESMSVAEKLALMERLWDDLSRQLDDVPLPEWHGEVLAERVLAIKEGRAQFEDWDEVKKELRERHA